MPPSPDDPSAPAPSSTIPKWRRRAITACLLLHLTAVVSAPAAVAPASDLARGVWTFFRPYLQLLYLNHGYHYFAPDPGPSTLLAFTVEKSDGTVHRDVIPNRRIWPRLMYHRHFMLTESLSYIASVSEATVLAESPLPALSQTRAEEMPLSDERSGPPGDGEPIDALPEPAPVRGLLRDWYHSYARHLLDAYDGERVELVRVVHFLPQIEWMQESIARGEPLTLSEPQSFTEFPIGTFDREGGPYEEPLRRPPPPESPADSFPPELPEPDRGGTR
jgi:hypothetical protein